MLKGNKLPSEDLLYENTLKANKQYAWKVIQSMIDKEYTPTPIQDYNLADYLEICEEYFRWLCNLLSHDKIVTKYEILFQTR